MISWDGKAHRTGDATNGRKCPAIKRKDGGSVVEVQQGDPLFHRPSLINETALGPGIDERETVDSNTSPSENSWDSRTRPG